MSVLLEQFLPSLFGGLVEKIAETMHFQVLKWYIFYYTAEFKLIKRSNTYNAVASILKAPCEYCKKDISINDTIDHLTKHCPEVP